MYIDNGLQFSDTNLKARKKLNVAEYMSDLNQEDEPQTRIVRHRRHVDSSSDDETAPPKKKKKKSLPQPPSKPLMHHL